LYQGRIVEAEPLILKALENNPQRSETFTTLGIYYWAIRSVGIGAAFQRAIELNPSNAEALASYASWAWVQGDVAEAVNYYRAALEMDPLNLVRYAELGYKLAFQGSRIEAQQVLDRMQHLFPTVPGYMAAVRITEAMGDLDEAIAWALLAREQEPGNADINGQLAELLARTGELEMAQYLEPEPGMARLFWQQRYQELADLGEMQSIDFPGDLDITFARAFALSALGQHQPAVDLLEAAGLPGTAGHESRRANELHAMYIYFSALRAAGKVAEAESVAESHIAFNEKFLRAGASDGWVPLLSAACAYAVINDEQTALQLLEDMVKIDAIPRLPWLQDLACFDDYQNKPRYQAVVATVEAKITAVRERIPAALARHGLQPLTEIALAEAGPQP
ncbi:MAG TPA: hypothetical protein VJN01_00240, partial [Xanthomonadales bacterium]|nr:hypothetical protein [Xanthomonadales bacterium]